MASKKETKVSLAITAILTAVEENVRGLPGPDYVEVLETVSSHLDAKVDAYKEEREEEG
jgi:hypothetical protein